MGVPGAVSVPGH